MPYTVNQYEAALAIAAECKHNKLEHMACAECVAEHLAEIGAGARPDREFFKEHKRVHDEVVKLRAAEDRHAEEALVLAEALSEARAAARVEHEYAEDARKHIATLDKMKAQAEKAERRRDEINKKYREVRNTLKDVLDELGTSKELVREGEEAIAKLAGVVAQLEARLDAVAKECADRDMKILDLTTDCQEWERVARVAGLHAKGWTGTALICLQFDNRGARHESIRSGIRAMARTHESLSGLTRAQARKYVADWMRAIRLLATKGIEFAKTFGWSEPEG